MGKEQPGTARNRSWNRYIYVAYLGVDFIESEKFPTLVAKPKDVKYTDLSCGENCMMMLDGKLLNNLY